MHIKIYYVHVDVHRERERERYIYIYIGTMINMCVCAFIVRIATDVLAESSTRFFAVIVRLSLQHVSCGPQGLARGLRAGTQSLHAGRRKLNSSLAA